MKQEIEILIYQFKIKSYFYYFTILKTSINYTNSFVYFVYFIIQKLLSKVQK